MHSRDGLKIGDTDFGQHLKWDSSYLIAGGPQNGASGVEFYNPALNQHYGPQSGGSCDNLSRSVVTISTKTDHITDNVEYWLLTEAARAFEPFATVISNSMSSADCAAWTGVCAVSVQNPDGSTCLYVANPTGSSQAFTVDENGYGFTYPDLAPDRVVSFWWTNPS